MARWLAGLGALVLLVAACQGEGSQAVPEPEMLDKVLAAFFAEELTPCTTNDECLTRRCDLTPVYTISVSAGYCLALPGAFERWQKVELAAELARWTQEVPALRDRVIAEIRNNYLAGDRPADHETAIVVLQALGGEEALGMLAREARERTGTLAELAGLALAEMGDKRGTEAAVQAAFSPVVRVRMHAARSAGGLCNKEALGVLAELLADDHPMVAEAAAAALGRCPGEEAATLLRGAEGFAARSAALKQAGTR